MDLNSTPTKYCVVDIETTGRKPSQTKVIEIAAYVVSEGAIIDEYQTLIHPETDINYFITKLTGINNEMVKDAPIFEEVAERFFQISKDCIFVAHNVSFDYGILRREFRRLGVDYRRDHLCTVQVSRKTLTDVPSHNLGKLSKHLGITIPNRHRAADDALATVELLNYLQKQTSLEDFVRKEIRPELLHPDLNINAIDQIPGKPGLITYINENKEVLFIEGVKQASNAIHNRLKPTNKNPDFLDYRKIAKIKFRSSGSEILAKLWEREAILMQPPQNNHLEKKLSYSHSIYLKELQNGHKQLVMEKKYLENALIHAHSLTDVKNLFKHLSKQYDLCFSFKNSKNSACKQCIDQQCLISVTAEKDYNKETERFIEEQTLPNGPFIVLLKGTQKNNRSAVLVEDKKITYTGILPKYLIRNKNIPEIKENLKAFSIGAGGEELLRRYLTEKDYKGLIPL